MSATPLDNASLQEASYLKERRANIVVRLLAESLVVVLVVVFGWWGMWVLAALRFSARRSQSRSTLLGVLWLISSRRARRGEGVLARAEAVQWKARLTQ